jgi:hypothetical protein
MQKKVEQSTATTFLEVLFTSYPGFEYDSTKAATDEFRRMCDFSGWGKHNRNRTEAREEFQYAIVKDFNNIYGTDEYDLGSWQSLCRVVGVVPIPGTLAECQQVCSLWLLYLGSDTWI